MLADKYAHRGYHDKPTIPENSMAAFRRAIEHGWGVEFDVHLIADGSLVVFHDEELERETGVRGKIEDYDIVNLGRLRLEETDERIPTFSEVLELFENTPGPDGKLCPLLIELKVARGNYRALVKAVCERLDTYSGDFVIESFDPRALIELRKIRPEIVRGQLVQNFIASPEGLPVYQRVVLTHMLFNPLTRPDFIAYRFSHGLKTSVMNRLRKRGVQFASWTIGTETEFRASEEMSVTPIFERFNPDRSEK